MDEVISATQLRAVELEGCVLLARQFGAARLLLAQLMVVAEQDGSGRTHTLIREGSEESSGHDNRRSPNVIS